MIHLFLQSRTRMEKKMKGQFYTDRSAYILEGFVPPQNVRCIEPFAGKGHLADWMKQGSPLSMELYDIDPKREDIVQRNF